MNKIILTGNIVRDIDIRYTQSNQAVVQNAIAVKKNFKNEDGKYESQFFNFVVWKNNAEILKKYADKGSKILIEGRLNNRDYEKEDGSKVYVTEVIADRIELLSHKQEKKSPEKEENAQNLEKTDNTDVFAQFGDSIEISEDMLPF